MTAASAGAVTLMFTDIQGSTRLLERVGDAYAELLQAHHAIVRAVLARHDGRELRTFGDAFFASFERPERALAAAAALQRELAARPWPAGEQVRVRIGIDSGSPRLLDGDYVGLDVHRAARICSAAHGGQVLVGGAARSALGGDAPGGLALRELGEYHLSDLNEPVALLQLAGDGLAERFPPPRTATAALAGMPGGPVPELFGRAAEEARLDRLLAEARLGRSGVLLLSGEPGIGKTALLRRATALGLDAGMEVLASDGTESEAEVPFGGLLALLRPALGELDRIPAGQADALRGALGMGPGVEADRFLVAAATLSLLSARSERAPLLLVIDDAHWLDDSSLAAILFAARRLLVDRMAVLLGVRTGASPILDAAGLPELRLAGVDEQAAAQIVTRHASAPPGPGVAEALGEATGGNPLALVELAAAAAGAPAPVIGALEVPTSVAGAYAQRIAGLPGPVRSVMALAAAEDGGRMAWIGAAAERLGYDLDDLAGAEETGLLTVGFGQLDWRHPLVRAAAYRAVPPAERRAAHAALAAALPATEEDRRAWHRAAAALGADEEVAAALEAAARRARARSAYAAAATAAERAAQLSPDEEARARRLLGAGDAAWHAGHVPRALARLDAALALDPPPALRAEIQHLRGLAIMRAGDAMTASAVLIDGAGAIEASDPVRAVVMLAEAADACVYVGRPREMLVAARRAFALLRIAGGDRARFFAHLALGTALIYNGEDEGAPLLEEAVALLDGSSVLSDDPRLLTAGAIAALWLRASPVGATLVDRAIATARRQGALGTLPFALALAARDAATTERWALGRALYEEAIALARETGQALTLCSSLAGLSGLLARVGADEACERAAGEALAMSERHGLELFRAWALAALGELELSRGRPDEAVRRLEAKRTALLAAGVWDPDLSPVPEIVEATLRGGARPDAALAEAIEGYAHASEAKGEPWALARLARTRGLLAADADAAGHFEAALALHDRTREPFERARTELCFGEALRRTGQRVRAREQLRAALATFEELGAAPWVERARSELVASGERARRRDPSTLDDLTAQELRIGLVLADGHTIREAAGTLFLSPKTVEYHLRNAYRKLGVHSREELAVALAGRRG